MITAFASILRARVSRRVAIIAAAVLLLEAPALGLRFQARPAAVSPEVLKRRLQAAFDSLHAAGQFPGGTAGFVLADGTSFGIAAGFADPAAEIPMTPASRMLIGSVGKTYVAAVALQLVQEKRLALGDPIERWLGSADWFARLPNGPGITVRMLMNHTSGLERYEFNDRFTADLTKQPDRTWRPEELVGYILDRKPPFSAGNGWSYSDTNYIVLGMIIERITGSPYYDEMRRRILVPFKLKDTVPSDSREIPGLVQGFAGPNNPFGGVDAMIANGKFAVNPQFEWTGGGLASTSLDLARWAKVLYEGRAFNKTILSEMLKGVPARLGPETSYGLGVIIRPTSLGPTYGHSGFFPGYLTEMAYFPALRAAIAVQINTSVPAATGKPLARFLTDFAAIIAGKPAG